MHIDGALLDEDMVAPDFVEQLGACIDALGVGHEEEQQAELGRSQFDRLTIGDDPMGRRVERQIADLDRFAGQVRRAAAQHGADAGDQFLRREGLGDVIVGAGFEALHLVFLMHPGGQHDDRHLAGPLVGSDFLGQRDAGLAGQHPVEQHEVGQRGADRRFGLFGAARPHDEACIFINNQDGGYVSNQFSGTPLVGLAGELAQPANFGETRAVNLATDARAAGNQFFTINLNTTSTAPTIDGTRETTGWSTRSQQSARTGFGNSNSGTTDYANGSELDGVYTRVAGGVLYFFLTGNLESNHNTMEIFIDTGSAQGQNRLRGDNPAVGGDGLHLTRMGDDGSNNGFTFDAGFNASYWVGLNCGDAPFALYVDYAQLSNNDGSGGGVGYYCGSSGAACKVVLPVTAVESNKEGWLVRNLDLDAASKVNQACSGGGQPGNQ